MINARCDKRGYPCKGIARKPGSAQGQQPLEYIAAVEFRHQSAPPSEIVAVPLITRQ